MQLVKSSLVILWMFFAQSENAISKIMPIEFCDLVKSSELVVLVDVVEYEVKGKGQTGHARARISKVVRGKTKNEDIEIHFQGYGITHKGEWLLFLNKSKKKTGAVYTAGMGLFSFWPVEQASSDKNSCCDQVTLLNYPIDHIKIESGLIDQFSVKQQTAKGVKFTKPQSGISIQKLINRLATNKCNDR